MEQINISSRSVKQFALFELGFRPFFLLAGLFSIIATIIWFLNFVLGYTLPLTSVTPIAWHGHEMVFGYTAAIIAGFLLTAVRNWTGIQTIKGLPLMVLVMLWLLARILPLWGSQQLFDWAALCDVLFLFGLIVSVLYPVIQVRQWRQLVIMSKLGLLLAADVFYYLGVYHYVEQGVSWGLLSGVYLIMALIFTLARRVIPFFIERGVGYSVQLKNSHFIDIFSLLLFAVLWIVDVFLHYALLTALLALILAVVHSIRLAGWYTKGIWKKPLLWVLFVGYGFFIIGFLLQALNYFDLYLTTIPLHAYTYGGIGMMTLGMMARISLGHTGRNINQPPQILNWVFMCLTMGAVVRVLLPIFIPDNYLLLIGLAQILWIIAFSLFLLQYLRIFIQPRVDGLPG